MNNNMESSIDSDNSNEVYTINNNYYNNNNSVINQSNSIVIIFSIYSKQNNILTILKVLMINYNKCKLYNIHIYALKYSK